VVAELGFYGTLNRVDVGTEDDGVELGDHLAWAEFAKGTAIFTGGAAGVLFGDVGEVGTIDDLLLEVVALVFGVYEDVTCGCASHGNSRKRVVKKRPDVRSQMSECDVCSVE
jgi:hypothetical protein